MDLFENEAGSESAHRGGADGGFGSVPLAERMRPQTLDDFVGQEEIAAILGPKKAEVVTQTQVQLQKRLDPYGISVKQFTLNEFRAPQAVMDAISLKNVMQQQALTAQNELQKNQFQAQGDSIKAAGRAKAILTEAEAQSRANTLLAQSITTNLVQYEMAKRWDGKMPQVSGSAMPVGVSAA